MSAPTPKNFNRLPTYTEPLTTTGNNPQTTRGWYQAFTGIINGQPTGFVSVQKVGPSPWTFTAPAGGTLILNGGTTTQVQVSRDQQTFFVTGQTSGMFPVSQGDSLVITYSVGPPTATFVPR